MDLFDNIETLFSDEKDEIMNQLRAKNNAERVLVLNDEINNCVLDYYSLFILNWNREDKDLPPEKRKPIKLYINSVGGEIFNAMNLVDVIEHSITPVIGVGFGIIASAAFHIYIACHERIAFPNSVFLMHDGELSISNSTSKAKDIMKFFERMEDRIKHFVLRRTLIDEDYYDSHFNQEVYMYADEAKEKDIVFKIIGNDVDLNYII